MAETTRATPPAASRTIGSRAARRMAGEVWRDAGCAPLVLEVHLHRELHLPRVAHALAQEAVEVEEARADERVDVVLAVEGVEHLDRGDDLHVFPRLEGPHEPPVEGE